MVCIFFNNQHFLYKNHKISLGGRKMNIYIGNIPKDMDEQEIIEMFAEYGSVKAAKIIRDRRTKVSRGYGFIEMEDESAAKKAIEDWDQGSIDNRVIRVNIAHSSQKDSLVLA
jgi:RNA recognition motif-containing protein